MKDFTLDEYTNPIYHIAKSKLYSCTLAAYSFHISSCYDSNLKNKEQKISNNFQYKYNEKHKQMILHLKIVLPL